MKTICYGICVSDPSVGEDAKSLVQEVMKLIQLNIGWEPVGGIFVISSPAGMRIGQAMVQKVVA